MYIYTYLVCIVTNIYNCAAFIQCDTASKAKGKDFYCVCAIPGNQTHNLGVEHLALLIDLQ